MGTRGLAMFLGVLAKGGVRGRGLIFRGLGLSAVGFFYGIRVN